MNNDINKLALDAVSSGGALGGTRGTCCADARPRHTFLHVDPSAVTSELVMNMPARGAPLVPYVEAASLTVE